MNYDKESCQPDGESEIIHHHAPVISSDDRARIQRVLFSPRMAQQHGVRLAALVAHVVLSTRDKLQAGQPVGEWDTRANFGEAIGVCARQAARLLAKARELGYLDYRSRGNCIEVWVMDEKLYRKHKNLAYYHKDLARLIGLTESILYCRIIARSIKVPEGQSLPGVKAHDKVWPEWFPFLTRKGASIALYRLKRLGLIAAAWSFAEDGEKIRRYWATKAESSFSLRAWRLAMSLDAPLPPNRKDSRPKAARTPVPAIIIATQGRQESLPGSLLPDNARFNPWRKRWMDGAQDDA